MLVFSQLPSDCFLLYMSLVHVPQHYIRKWTIISHSPLLSCLTINTMGILSTLPLFNNESILSLHRPERKMRQNAVMIYIFYNYVSGSFLNVPL